MRLRVLLIALPLLLVAGCSSGSQATSCAEFAGEVSDLLSRDVSAAEIETFIQDSENRVAELIAADPDRAEPCVTAVMEALFTVGFADLEDLLKE